MIRIQFILILLVNILLGDEISILITKIQHSQPSQKRVLINQLKIKLRNTNQQTRVKAMQKLRLHQQHRGGLQHKDLHKETSTMINNHTKNQGNKHK